jgi:acetyltransferase-like isoleucine patch superfamily enzyme
MILDRFIKMVGLRYERIEHARALEGLKVGQNVSIGPDPEIHGAEHIELGDDVRIGHRVRLQAVTSYNEQIFSPALRIGRGTSLENDCMITCNTSVELGEHVMVAGNVFISDHEHQYQDAGRPVQAQDLTTDGGVVIGDGSHIGQNVCIIGRVTIGEHAVVGANSVVTRDVPAYSVVAGAPAKVIRRYDAGSREWKRTYDR